MTSRRATARGLVPVVLVMAAVLAAMLALAGCVGATSRTTFPPPGSTPGTAGGDADATVQQVIAALGAAGISAAPADRQFRPPEGPLLAAAPRELVQVDLPNDPDPTWIVVYGLGSPQAAGVAANDHAAWISSNPGRINFPPGTQFVIQVVGSTVVFFTWLPASSPDPGAATIANTLATIGAEVPVPN
jgi:hypothetical protein